MAVDSDSWFMFYDIMFPVRISTRILTESCFALTFFSRDPHLAEGGLFPHFFPKTTAKGSFERSTVIKVVIETVLKDCPT